MSPVPPAPGRPARLAGPAVLFATGFLLWLLNHPYVGIWHDSAIYGLLAAHWLHPEALSHDLFFRFGSQGDLSLFTPLFGTLVRWLGLDRASWWTLLAGGAGWTVAMLLLSRRLLGPGLAASVAVLLAAVLSVSYSPNAVTFVLTENFATARSWALPVGLGAVAAWAAGRWMLALALAGTALLLHPLLGVWPLALCILGYLGLRLAGAAVVLILAAVAVVGASNPDLPYLRLMDGDWLAFAQDVAPDVMFKPERMRLTEFGAALSCLLLGARWGSAPNRALYMRMLLLGTAGAALALMSIRLPLEILVQGQPWRVMWLLLPLALIAVLDVAQRLGHGSRAGPALLALAAAIVATGSARWLPAILALGLAAFLPGAWLRSAGERLARWRRPLGAGAALLWLLLLPGLLASLDIAGSQMLLPWWQGAEWLHGLLAGGRWEGALLLGLLGSWLGALSSSRLAFGALAALAATTLFAIVHWDHRPERLRQKESCYLDARCPPHPFQATVPAGATVFWPGRELQVWFAMNRASYFGEIQRTGVVFSRAKYAEWRRRERLVETAAGPRDLCADPLLNWLVLPQALPGVAPRAAVGNAYLYSCEDFRAVPPAPTVPALRQKGLLPS